MLVLDGVGMLEIPGVSQAADLASGIIAAKNGDYLSAGLSAGGMITAVGTAFTVAKWGNKARKAGNVVDEAADAVEGAMDAGKHVDEVADATVGAIDAGKHLDEVGGAAKGALGQGARSLEKHHVFIQSQRKWFAARGITNIDDYCILLSRKVHLTGVHGKGLGLLKGRWNQRWLEFIAENPNATPNEIFLQAEWMLRDFGLEHLKYVPYKQ